MKLANSGTKINTMTPKATVCVHGNITQAEYPEHIDEISRKGWGTTFWGKENTTNWFHLPLSIPAFLDGHKPKLTKVYFYFHNTSRSPITTVHLYDGPKVIKAFDNLRLAGDHAKALDRSNTFNMEVPLDINFGLGLSVKVEFPASTETSPPRWILFTAAGAEFRV